MFINVYFSDGSIKKYQDGYEFQLLVNGKKTEQRSIFGDMKARFQAIIDDSDTFYFLDEEDNVYDSISVIKIELT